MLHTNRYRILGLFFLLTPAISLAAEKVALSLDQAVDQALKSNPNLAAIQARAQAMAALPDQMAALPDPTLHFNALNLPTNTFELDQEPMTQMQVGISQAFPFPGKRSLKEAASELHATAANNHAEEIKSGLIQNVKVLWWQLFYLDRALEIIDKNRTLLKQFIDIARTKYEVGKGLQQDVLLAQLELSKLLDKQIQLKAARKNKAIHLNQLIDNPAQSEVLLPKTTALNLPAAAENNLLLEKADSKRPLLLQHRQLLEANKKQLKLARKSYYPDFNVGAFYGDRQGNNPNGNERSDFVSLKLALTLPLYATNKQSKAIEQRATEFHEKQFALKAAENKVFAEINQALTDYQQAREQFELFQHGIIPQAQQTVASMLAGYQVDKVDFLNLIRSQVTLFNYETRYWLAFTSAKQSLAKLVAAVGEETIYE